MGSEFIEVCFPEGLAYDLKNRAAQSSLDVQTVIRAAVMKYLYIGESNVK
jgi:hypothetical protein